ncbi:MAG: FeoB-associated Cys-rich membrane protein [Chitinispirillaceae bacterium]
MWQSIVVGIIVALAAGGAAIIVWKSVRDKSGCEGCRGDCGKCGMKED